MMPSATFPAKLSSARPGSGAGEKSKRRQQYEPALGVLCDRIQVPPKFSSNRLERLLS